MKSTYKALLITAFATSALALQAQGMSFADFDTNNNGVVSEQEFNDAKNQRIAARAKEGRQMRGLANAPSFASIDINQDGQLTVDEMQQMQQGRGNKGQRRGLDKKMARPPQPVFADFDLDNDNSLSEQEYYDARNKRIGDRAKEGRQMRGLANVAAFADIDVNDDGKVSPGEFSSFILGHQKNAH